ncbi:unnamed protein product [Kuraishia capsulata CBS 1993]|uniref:tRNA-dihydrouridine synthase n=1 Tax=Kuraishia capsulata CBS 1993 TaxID=1382522 RepID=W6MJP1_9ASCO|nr:uncharacterized protein KUCA_T00000668001 [Kuraishia capsulata CBS 1993]CDK24702.1 unnamed protein product [Kuraishia capsulata CBS 1993]
MAESAPTANLAGLPVRNIDHNPLRILQRCSEEGRPAFIAGPMVRYSKLPFRELVRDYSCDIVYSPMILAREFVRNGFARDSDFSTNEKDRSLIVQIGTNNTEDLLRMVEMIHPYVDGIGLNCGCPIKEQIREGIGAALMSQPDKVAEMVKAVKHVYGDKICLEVKIRVHADVSETVAFAKKIEAAGVDFITVHGRTKNTRSSEAADFDKIKAVKEAVSCPVVANGDCRSLEDAIRISKYTGCEGVMSVRGILSNPALYSGFEKTPWGAVEKFWDLSTAYGLPFRLVQHHLSCMLDGQLPRKTHILMNELKSFVQLIEFFDKTFDLKRRGDPGFGTRVAVPFRQDRESSAHI